MTTLELLLIIITLLTLTTSWINRKIITYTLPVASVLTALLTLSTEGFNLNVIEVYLIDAALFVLTTWRIISQERNTG